MTLEADLILRLTANAEQAKAEIAALKAQLKDLILTVGELRTAQSGITGLGGDAAGLDAQAAAADRLSVADAALAEQQGRVVAIEAELGGTTAAVTAGLDGQASATGAIAAASAPAATATGELAGATETLATASSGLVGALEREGTAIAGGATAAAAAVSAKAALAAAAEAAAVAEEDLAGATQLAVTLTNEQGESMQATLVSKEQLAIEAEGAAVAEESLAEAATTATVATNAAGAAARGAALDEIRLAESADLVAVAEEARAKATRAASGAVADALKGATVAVGEWASITDVESKKAAAAFLVARDAVGTLEVAIERASALPAPIPANAEAQLVNYEAAIRSAATAEGQLATAATLASDAAGGQATATERAAVWKARLAVAAGTASDAEKALASSELAAKIAADDEAAATLRNADAKKLQSVLAGVARGNVLGLARALQSLGSTEGLVALVALVAINKALKELQDRGADVSTFVDLMGAALDKLASATGNASSAVAAMESGFGKAQEKLDGVTDSTRQYETATGLLAATGIDAAKVFEGYGEVLKTSSSTINDVARLALPGLADALINAEVAADIGKKALNAFNVELNQIRLVDPALAQQIVEGLRQLSKQFTDGEIDARKFADGLSGLKQKMDPLVPVARAVGQELKEEFGAGAKAAEEALGGLLARMGAAEQSFKAAKLSGVDLAGALELNKAEFAKVSEELGRYVGAIAIMPEVQQKAIAQFLKLAEGAGKQESALKKLEKTIEDQTQKFFDLQAAMRSLDKDTDTETERFNKHRLAITANADAIRAQVAAMQALIDKHQDENGQLQASVNLMKGWLAEIGQTSDKTNVFKENIDKLSIKIVELNDRIKANTQAYAENIAKIEEHRSVAIAASDAELQKVEKDFNAEYAALTELHKRGELSQQEYGIAIAELLNEEIRARHETLDKEDAINAEAAASKKTATDKYIEDEDRLQAANRAYVDLLKVAQEEFEKTVGPQVEGQRQIAEAAGKTAIAFHGAAGGVKALGTDIGGIEKDIRAHAKLHESELQPKLKTSTKHVSALGEAFKKISATEIPQIAESIRTTLFPPLVELEAKLDRIATKAAHTFSTSTGSA